MAGFVLPVFSIVTLYWKSGFIDELYRWNILLNFVYLKSGVPLSYSMKKALLNTFFFVISYLPFLYALYWEKFYEKNPNFESDELGPIYNQHLKWLLDDLQKNKPKLILDTSTSPYFASFRVFPILKIPYLNDFVSINYEKVDYDNGVVFYVRKKNF